MDAMQMTVKNTFVHLDLPTGAARSSLRRATSLPRSLRIAGAPREDLPMEPDFKHSPSRAPSSCAEVSTEAELSEAECDSFGPTPPPSPRCGGGDGQRGAGQGSALDPKSFPFVPSAVLPQLVPVPLSALAPPPPTSAGKGGSGAEAPRQRLNSKAQAWTPGGTNGAAAPRGGAPHQGAGQGNVGALLARLASVVSAASAALGHCLKDGPGVQASEAPSGWSIVIQLPLADFQRRRGEALAIAQQALTQAARSCKGVHLLGSTGKPFMATPFGCTAMLGAVLDEEQACWDSLRCGFCSRGHSCRWQHSVSRATVNIMVKIAEAN